MTIQIRFFSTLHDYFRTGEKVIEIDAPRSAKDIFEELVGDSRQASAFMKSVRCAVNHEYVSWETMVGEGCELAFIPPVSGG